MPNKQQFWDYIVTVEIKVAAADREEAKQLVMNDLCSLQIPHDNAAIVRIRPVVKK